MGFPLACFIPKGFPIVPEILDDKEVKIILHQSVIDGLGFTGNIGNQFKEGIELILQLVSKTGRIKVLIIVIERGTCFGIRMCIGTKRILDILDLESDSADFLPDPLFLPGKLLRKRVIIRLKLLCIIGIQIVS